MQDSKDYEDNGALLPQVVEGKFITVQDLKGVSETRLVIENLTEEKWYEAGVILSRVDNANTWWHGDWYNCWETKHKDEICKALGMNLSKLRTYGLVSKKVPPEMRRKALTWSHHREVVALTREQMYRVLRQAEELKLTVLETREEVRKIRFGKAIEHNPIRPDEKWSSYETEAFNDLESGYAVLANRATDRNLVKYAEGLGFALDIDKMGSNLKPGWGNPFIPGVDHTAEKCVELYQWYLNLKPSLQERIIELKGKCLVCTCRPNPCHGDFLLEIVNGLTDIDTPQENMDDAEIIDDDFEEEEEENVEG